MTATLSRKLVRRLLPPGTTEKWDASRTRNNHLKLTMKYHVVFAPTTPSDPRGVKNFHAQLRRCERGDCKCHRPPSA